VGKKDKGFKIKKAGLNRMSMEINLQLDFLGGEKKFK